MLPAAVVALSVVLLAVVIVRTASSQVKAWKGNPLTLLLFDGDQEIVRDSRLHRGWESAIGKTGVKLLQSEGVMRTLHAT